MWGKSHWDGIPVALRVIWKRWVFDYFWDALTIQFQTHWSITWFKKSINPLGWPNTLIRCTLRWLIAVRGQERNMNIQDGTTSTSVAQFSLFFYSVHSPFLILHYQAQLRQFYTPHESLNTLDANFTLLRGFFIAKMFQKIRRLSLFLSSFENMRLFSWTNLCAKRVKNWKEKIKT